MGVDTRCYHTYIDFMTELRDEIRQNQPFQSSEQEAHLNIIRSAAKLGDDFEKVLSPFRITGTQYNVLRILRGAEPNGLCRNDVRDRMVTRMPDMTRLLDRMEKADLVIRTRDEEDRRLVTTRITQKGLQLLEKLDLIVAEEHKRRLGHMSQAELKQLNHLLAKAREGA